MQSVELFPMLSNDLQNALTYYLSTDNVEDEFVILTAGHEVCAKDKPTVGPDKLGYYILHYVHSGAGRLTVTDSKNHVTTYSIQAGQLFLISPNVNVCYTQDWDDPWEYSWVCFYGSEAYSYAHRLAGKDNPVISPREPNRIAAVFEQLQHLDQYHHARDLRVTAIALNAFAEIIEATEELWTQKNTKNHIRNCLTYIQEHYCEPDISVNKIARELSLNPKYLSRLFTATLRIPLSKYITMTRLQKACSLLTCTDSKIKDIAASVGYEDALLFSRIFSNIVKKSPSQFRKETRIPGSPSGSGESRT